MVLNVLCVCFWRHTSDTRSKLLDPAVRIRCAHVHTGQNWDNFEMSLVEMSEVPSTGCVGNVSCQPINWPLGRHDNAKGQQRYFLSKCIFSCVLVL